jgi:hypothetical protein
MSARIYQPAKTAMQSGTAKTRKWVLEFVPAKPKQSDPLMGWIGSSETATQVRLSFPTLDDAKQYAESHGIAYRVMTPHKRKRRTKTYADNFRHDRVSAWTH